MRIAFSLLVIAIFICVAVIKHLDKKIISLKKINSELIEQRETYNKNCKSTHNIFDQKKMAYLDCGKFVTPPQITRFCTSLYLED